MSRYDLALTRLLRAVPRDVGAWEAHRPEVLLLTGMSGSGKTLLRSVIGETGVPVFPYEANDVIFGARYVSGTGTPIWERPEEVEHEVLLDCGNGARATRLSVLLARFAWAKRADTVVFDNGNLLFMPRLSECLLGSDRREILVVRHPVISVWTAVVRTEQKLRSRADPSDWTQDTLIRHFTNQWCASVNRFRRPSRSRLLVRYEELCENVDDVLDRLPWPIERGRTQAPLLHDDNEQRIAAVPLGVADLVRSKTSELAAALRYA